MRPESIAAIAARTLAEDRRGAFSVAVREFLDEFYAARNAARRPAMLADAPVPLSASRDALLSGLAAHLAQVYRLATPAWCETHGRALKRPVFLGDMENAKAWLLVVTPPAFRERMIFVAHEDLKRV